MKKIITYGTFDLFHKGHYNMLKRAKEYGDYLVVGVTGENYDVGRGKLNVYDSLATRIENVQKTGFADEIIVEEYLGQKIGDIIKYDIDSFVIGDDWVGKFDHLSKYCNMVYLERTKGISSTQIREETFNQYDIGIVCDFVDDNQIVKEAKLVNGFEVKNVYSDDNRILDAFKEKYDVKNTFEDYDAMIESSDIIYVHCDINERFNYIYRALKAGKHVLYDPPISFSSEKLKKLIELSKQKNVIFMENNKMVHIYVFNQLLWMTQGGLIGDILSFNCSISKNDITRSNLFYDLSVVALLPMIKIMGENYEHFDFQVSKEGDNIEFASMNFVYGKGRAIINVGNNVRVDNQIEIIGTKGTIRMKDDWWRSKSFELHTPGSNDVQLFNTNFEGNGFKYLIREMSRMLSNNRVDSKSIFEEESLKIAEILEHIRKQRYNYD
ncbi:adenylyltransferase/cytidyltransferase family protein [Methanobrevibacter sp.]|uniref:adenylyltransferase/cytidyltransferase family protein n=1 Tax=Methanobrevibacter sp. TaxID=66852 RepID=UPI0026DFBCF6|nr:adenylyltransferase/cytidyltransferase family protein [Methanobrevibacter sp.]MDO5824626.1 adenylyltransferase/cytidyltransferase family protein [Methanobrevibacter sp.]